MANYFYFRGDDPLKLEVQQQAFQAYAKGQNFNENNAFTDEQSVKVHWHKRSVFTALETLKADDTLYIYEAASVSRSTSQMLEIFHAAFNKGVHLFFAKYDLGFWAKKNNNLKDLLQLMKDIDGDFIARRTTDALERRREAGLPLGRPKGRQNSSLKLDKHRKDIVKYLDLKISKASIAKLVNCHPQTLYDWIDRHGIPDAKPRKPRTRFYTSATSTLTEKEEMLED